MVEPGPQDISEQVEIFKALSDPTRLRLIKLIHHQRHPPALCVNALAARLQVTQSAVSQHLRILKGTGLVSGQRRGYHIHYCVNRRAMHRFHRIMTAVFKDENEKRRQEDASHE